MTSSFPSTTFNIVETESIVENLPQKVLLVGQKVAGGSAPANVVQENIDNSGAENALFGANSMLANMVNSFKSNGENTTTRVDAIALDDDGSAVDATATDTYAGAATEDGSFTLYVGSEDFTFTVPVANGDTANDVGTALAALINANTKVQVTAANVAGVVTLTATNGGEEGNFIGLRGEGAVAGLTRTLTTMSGGAANPSLTNVFDTIGTIRYQTIVFPGTYDISVLRNFLESRFNVTNDILDGVGIMVLPQSFSTFRTTVSGENAKTMCLIINRPQVSAPDNRFDFDIFETPSRLAAHIAAKRSIRLTTGANIANAVATSATGDTIGGIELSSLPYANTPFPRLPLIRTEDLLTLEEVEELNDAGGTVISNNPANSLVVAGQFVTTYKTNAAGNADTQFKFLNYVDTISAAREFFFNNMRNRFRQSRLTTGELVEFRSIANEASIAAYFDSLYQLLEEMLIVIKGADALRFFKANRTVSINLQAGRADIFAKVPIITQFRSLIGNLQLSFDETNTI